MTINTRVSTLDRAVADAARDLHKAWVEFKVGVGCTDVVFRLREVLAIAQGRLDEARGMRCYR